MISLKQGTDHVTLRPRRPLKVPQWLHDTPSSGLTCSGFLLPTPTFPPNSKLSTPSWILISPHVPFYLNDGYLVLFFCWSRRLQTLNEARTCNFSLVQLNVNQSHWRPTLFQSPYKVLKIERWTKHNPHPQASYSPEKETTCINILIWGTTWNCRNTIEIEQPHREEGTVLTFAGLAVRRWFLKGQERTKQHSGSTAWSIQAILERWVFL